jgi:hypothetical protein
VTSRSNIRTIICGMLTYGNDNELRWPVSPRDASGAAATGFTTDADLRATSAGSFEFLSVFEADLVPKIFHSPSISRSGPARAASSSVAYADGVSSWAVAMGNPDLLGKVCYAYDWTVPQRPSIQRAVVAERGEIEHRPTVVVGYTDGHTNSMSKSGAAVPADVVVQNIDGTTMQWSFISRESKDAGDDDMFTGTADQLSGANQPRPSTLNDIGTGSSARCFLF